MPNFSSNLIKALALTLLPPALVGGLYLHGSTTGCGGGDCTGPMIGILLLGLAAVPVTLVGITCLVGVLLGGLWDLACAGLRRLRA